MRNQPWRLIVLGLIPLLVILVVQLIIESQWSSAFLKGGATFLATIVSVMVGALFGTAITNRVDDVYNEEVNAINTSMSNATDFLKKPYDEIIAKLFDQKHALTVSEMRSLIKESEELLSAYWIKMAKLSHELSELTGNSNTTKNQK